MSTRLSSAAVIEGSLTANIDDDSSDDESDDQQLPSPLKDYEMGTKNVLDSDEDEELEVFTESGSTTNSNVKKKIEVSLPAVKEKNEMSLVDAMIASVNNVESFGSQSDNADRVTSVTSKVLKVSASSPAPKQEPPSTDVDVFGIAYKPFMKKKEEYSMPKGAAFEDEAEFEMELKKPIPAKAKHEDDEFDFDDIPETEDNLDSSEKSVPAKRAADNAARAKREAEDEVKFMAALKDENKLRLQAEEERVKTLEFQGTKTEVAKPSIRVAAQQSLDEIVGIYSSGLGDQDVKMLDIDLTKKSSDQNQAQKGVTTIDEGDEDEAERVEQEEDLRVVTATTKEDLLKIQLEAEWETVTSAANEIDFNLSADAAVDQEYADITYGQALAHLSGVDLSEFEIMICVREEQATSWSLLNRPTLLKFEGSEEKLKFPFLLAQLNYDPSAPQLLNIQRKIFKALIECNTSIKNGKEIGKGDEEVESFTSLLCPRVGPHWERIGFQGLDPRTDINRSMKMLAILQTLNMVETVPSLTRLCFEVSNLTPSQKTGGHDLSWPLMCVSIMFTKETVIAMRSGFLNKECNRRQDVLSVMNQFHQACFFDFLKRVIAEPTMHHALHLAKVRDLCKTNPMDMLKNYILAEENDFTVLSLDPLYTNIRKAPPKTIIPNKNASQSKVPEAHSPLQSSPPPQDIEMEKGDLNFDDLEVIEKSLDAKNEALKSGNAGEKKSFSKSMWSTLTGGGKAAKFKE